MSGERRQEVRHSPVLHSFLPAHILARINLEIKCCEAYGYLFKRQVIIEKSLMMNSHLQHSGISFIPVLLLLLFYSPASSTHGSHSHTLPLVSNQVRAPWRKVVFSSWWQDGQLQRALFLAGMFETTAVLPSWRVLLLLLQDYQDPFDTAGICSLTKPVSAVCCGHKPCKT